MKKSHFGLGEGKLDGLDSAGGKTITKLKKLIKKKVEMSSQRRKCVCSQDGCQTVTMGARGGDSHRNDNKLKMQTSPNKYTQYLYSWSPLGGGGGEFGFQSSHSSSSSKSSSSSSSSSSSESRRHFFWFGLLGRRKTIDCLEMSLCDEMRNLCSD